MNQELVSFHTVPAEELIEERPGSAVMNRALCERDTSNWKDEIMQTFELTDIVAKARNQPWLEFLRVSTLSVGIYRLRAGQADDQQPHTEDEVYYVVSGKGRFRAGNENKLVGPGTIIFVERSVEHRFYDISEDLTILVFFAPPEGEGRGSG